MRLRRFRLSKEEWELLSQLQPLLDIFLHVTRKVSKTRPLLHDMIPLFDAITHAFDDYINNTSMFPAVQAAARHGLTLLNKCYGLTDDSIMYCIAMCEWAGFLPYYFM